MVTLQDANFLGYDCVLIKDCTAQLPLVLLASNALQRQQCFGFVTDSNAIFDAIQSCASAISNFNFQLSKLKTLYGRFSLCNSVVKSPKLPGFSHQPA